MDLQVASSRSCTDKRVFPRLGNGVVIHIDEFLSEIETNEAKGMARVTPERLRISDRAHMVFDFHRVADRMQEDERKNSQ